MQSYPRSRTGAHASLPTVEDRSDSVHSGSAVTGGGSSAGSTRSRSPPARQPPAPSLPAPCQQPSMKRSRYISAMASSANESDDLILMLSRPTSRQCQGSHASGLGSGSGGGGSGSTNPRPNFFELKRPSRGGGAGKAAAGPDGLARRIPSALRMGEGNGEQPPQQQMRKNSSVTFGVGTKQGSKLGLLDGSGEIGGGGNAAFHGLTRPPAAKGAMRKSQSIAAPQFMLSHQNSIAAPPPVASDAGGDGGNASFPIYFNKLSTGGSSSSNGTADDGGGGIGGKQGPDAAPASMAMRSKSVNTLQYYYQNPLPGVRDPGQVLRANASKNSLRFKDLLDVGDGVENDLNVRSRNQRWKEFRTFSTRLGTIGDDDDGDDDAGALEQRPASSHPPPPPPTGTVAGAHRAAVSVQDLSVLRRAAARMGDRGGGAASGSSTALSAMVTSRLGAASGGGGGNAAPFSSFPAADPVPGDDDTMQRFRRALMASSGDLSSLAGSASRGGGGLPQHSSGLGAPGLGRRSHTVGAGLAYGGHGMSTTGRLSRFDLTAAESMGSFARSVASSGGSASVTGGGKNEEW
mmetsp:Transcript_9204/g.21388  ORF Transcript_9204/g.21388 Transcript_9204/m.21388 type:complete len:575 (-) Transcript_9204:74-1798(-)